MALRIGEDGFPELGMEEGDIYTQERIALVAFMATQVDPESVERLIASYNRVHTLGILDPSAYMRSMGPLEQRSTIAAAFATFQKAALAFREVVMEEAGQ